MSDAETWRVEFDNGEVVDVLAATTRGDWVATVEIDGHDVSSQDGAHTAHLAVLSLVAWLSWPVVAILAPGQPTRADMEREIARLRGLTVAEVTK
jgi:hypothetical protein